MVIHWETFTRVNNLHLLFQKWSYTERYLLRKTTCTYYFRNGHTPRDIYSGKQLALAISERVIHCHTHFLGKTTCTYYSRERRFTRENNLHLLFHRDIFTGKQHALTISEMVIHWEIFSQENNLHLLFQKWSYTERHLLGKTTCTYYFRNGHTQKVPLWWLACMSSVLSHVFWVPKKNKVLVLFEYILLWSLYKQIVSIMLQRFLFSS